MVRPATLVEGNELRRYPFLDSSSAGFKGTKKESALFSDWILGAG